MRQNPQQPEPGRTPQTETHEAGGPQHKSGLEPTQPIRRSSEPIDTENQKESNVESQTDRGTDSAESGGQTRRQVGFGADQRVGQGPGSASGSSRESSYGQTTGASTQPTGRPGNDPGNEVTPNPSVASMSGHPDRATSATSSAGAASGAGGTASASGGTASGAATRGTGTGEDAGGYVTGDAYDRASRGEGPGGNWWHRVEDGWTGMRARVRQQWDRLTDDDVEDIRGRRERLEHCIRDRYGITEDEARRQVDEWGTSLGTA